MQKRVIVEKGQQYGMLTLTGEEYVQGKYKRMVMAVCECGITKGYCLDHLRRGITKSCGCILRKYPPVKLGDVFNRLTVIGEITGSGDDAMILVRCVCGIEEEVNVRRLKSGRKKSCGCIAIEHGLSKHPLYKAWHGMRDRCANDKYYQNRVTVCKEWDSDFMAFYNWAIDKWKPGLELDKDILYSKKFGVKVGVIYSPEFCCFVTPKENGRTKRNSRIIEYNGLKKPLSQWSEELNLNRGAVSRRLDNGWEVERAFLTPVKTA